MQGVPDLLLVALCVGSVIRSPRRHSPRPKTVPLVAPDPLVRPLFYGAGRSAAELAGAAKGTVKVSWIMVIAEPP